MQGGERGGALAKNVLGFPCPSDHFERHTERRTAMARQPERTPREWFEEAERAYIERHQACPSCSGQHQVYRGQRGHRLQYYCPACDFFTFHDESSGQY